jgi:hypothetical protein
MHKKTRAAAAAYYVILLRLQVCFLTSQLRGSGTDSTVHFELRGDRGSSGSIKVAAGREAFERGAALRQLLYCDWLTASNSSTGMQQPLSMSSVLRCEPKNQVSAVTAVR